MSDNRPKMAAGEAYTDMCDQINWFRSRVAQLHDEITRLRDENALLRKLIAEVAHLSHPHIS